MFIEDLVVSTIQPIIQLKIDQIRTKKDLKTKEEEVLSSLNLTNAISFQRSIKGLLNSLRQALPVFFKFESAGILLRDLKTNNLYTI